MEKQNAGIDLAVITHQGNIMLVDEKLKNTGAFGLMQPTWSSLELL